jgi:uncharacterized protein (DUF2141 family)
MNWNLSLPIIAFLVMAVLISMPAPAAVQSAGDLTVRVVGLKSNKGKVRYGLFHNERAFKKGGGHTLKNGTCEIQNHGGKFRCDITIPQLPHGVYAVMLGHDENNDGEIGKLFPREPAGVSNYHEKLWWYPKFEKAKFIHNKENTFLEISVY